MEILTILYMLYPFIVVALIRAYQGWSDCRARDKRIRKEAEESGLINCPGTAVAIVKQTTKPERPYSLCGEIVAGKYKPEEQYYYFIELDPVRYQELRSEKLRDTFGEIPSIFQGELSYKPRGIHVRIKDEEFEKIKEIVPGPVIVHLKPFKKIGERDVVASWCKEEIIDL